MKGKQKCRGKSGGEKMTMSTDIWLNKVQISNNIPTMTALFLIVNSAVIVGILLHINNDARSGKYQKKNGTNTFIGVLPRF